MKKRLRAGKAATPEGGAPIAPYNFETRGISIEDWLKEQLSAQQGRTLNILLYLFVFVVVLTFLLIFLRSFEYIKLSEEFMMWLGGATIAEVAGMLLIIVRKLWT